VSSSESSMNMITDQSYLDWQKKIAERIFFRRFWIFWGIYSVFFISFAALYILYTGQLKVILLALASFIFARFVVSPFIYIFYKKERPYQRLKFNVSSSKLFSTSVTRHNSFPSDHSISFASIVLIFGYYFPYLGFILVLAGLLNGMGRVILGYHYALDIIAGWIVGTLTALIAIYWLAPMLFTR
jgi:undecaprenyl-diphosphatase